MYRSLLLRLVALLALLCPTAGRAATVPASPPALGKAQILLPASFSKLMDMDFGLLTVTTAGTAILDSSSDSATTTGGVLLVGGTPHAAIFEAVSPSRNIVKISLPKQSVKLTRVVHRRVRWHSLQGRELIGAQAQDILQLCGDRIPAPRYQGSQFLVQHATLPQHSCGELVRQPAIGSGSFLIPRSSAASKGRPWRTSPRTLRAARRTRGRWIALSGY